MVRLPETSGTALPEATTDRLPLLPPAPIAAGQHFGGIVFAEHITGDGQPAATSSNFSGGTRQVWALSSYAGMREGAAWRREWKRNGQVVSAVGDIWLSGEAGVLAYPLADAPALAGGAYTFSLYLDGRLAQEASFTVGERPPTTAGQGEAAEFSSILFAQDVTADGHLVNPAEAFETGIPRVWAYFNVRNPDPTLPWRLLWERDGAVALDDRQDMRENANDGWYAFALDDDNGLANGRYTLTLSVAGLTVQQAAFEVASPTPTPNGTAPDSGGVAPAATPTPATGTVTPDSNAAPAATPTPATGTVTPEGGGVTLTATLTPATATPDSGVVTVTATLTPAAGTPAPEGAAVTPAAARTAVAPETVHVLPTGFGPIVFAQAADAQNEAVDPAMEFDAGLTRVYASFFFHSMRRGQMWTREWLRDGVPLLRKDAAWDLAADGVDAISLEDRGGLAAGTYSLNLYAGGRLVRSASFALRAAPTAADLPPNRPEDLIDRDLLPAWRLLAGSNSESLRRLARFALSDHIPIRFGELSAPATYRHSSTLCRTEPGVVLVSRAQWSRATWDESAATLAHELTHAEQLLSAGYPCDCSVEREMQAYTAELFQLQTRGRKDLLQQDFGYAYDARGKFSQTLLWAHIRKLYTGCRQRG